MHKWLQKIIFIVLSVSFFISAVEMDIGEARNTFFDEYDTYVRTEQVSLEQTEVIQQEHDALAFISCLISQYKSLNDPADWVRHSPPRYFNLYPPKIFLRNASWRI